MANNSQTVSLSWSMKVSQRETCFTTTKIPSSSKKHFEKLNYLLWSIHFQLKFHYKVYYPVVLNPLTPGSETWQILLCLTPHNFAHQLVLPLKLFLVFETQPSLHSTWELLVGGESVKLRNTYMYITNEMFLPLLFDHQNSIFLLAQARWSFDKIFYLEVHHLSADQLPTVVQPDHYRLPTSPWT